MSQATRSHPKLSVVIITRNEAQNVARAIESVLREAEGWPTMEVVLVDSASTDETVDIAKRYPINILRLKPGWFLSPPAGRYIGTMYSRAELIMYLDGDMELAPGWLDLAVPFLQERPEVAGVAGYRRDIHVQNGQIIGQHDMNCSAYHVIDAEGGLPAEVRHFGGAALYKRSALMQVGGFNPYLLGEGEPELCMRLRNAEYKLMYVPQLMCNNYTIPVRSLRYFVDRFRKNRWIGHGQVARYHLRTGMLWMAIKKRGVRASYVAGILISFVSVMLALWSGNIAFLGAGAVLVGMFFVYYWCKKGSILEVGISLLHQSFVAYGTVRGFLMKARRPEEYPTDVEIVQESHHE
jgi:glycosyltransferase involved in cell wall biosynthesis